MSKQYGLIVPDKNKHVVSSVVARHSIFNDDSDSDEQHAKPTGMNTKLKRQDRVTREKALEEDPTVYQYDEVYDEIEQKRKDSKSAKKEMNRKPKYINRLLAAAERRKRENERRIERQVQKEREEEGDEFKDKESFVTSSYRKKLEELKALEEQEKREDYLEAIGDVRKQGNLDGFYRHLYDQTVNYEDRLSKENMKESEKDVTTEKSDDKTENADENEAIETEDKNSKSPDNNSEKKSFKKLNAGSAMNKRKYRKRDSSGSENEENNEEIKMEHLPYNLDADSDFSIDSDTSEEDEDDGESKNKKSKFATAEDESKLEHSLVAVKIENSEVGRESENTRNINEEDDEVKKKRNENFEKENAVEDSNTKENGLKNEVKADKYIEAPKKPKIDIWKKRTVGKVFEEALQRYFERKALREAGN